MRTVAVVQARMGSTRLPGKVLMDVGGAPMLARVLDRLARARRVDEVVVATTDLPRDDALAAWCAERGRACFRGSEDDVLDRYYQAARAHGADVVVRVTSDCPLIDPEVVDRVAEALEAAGPSAGYASNIVPERTFPRGLDTEAIRMEVLEAAWREADDAPAREHVTPFIHRHPGRFGMVCVTGEADESGHRWTVDTPEDLALVREVYAAFPDDRFGWEEVLALFRARPALAEINAHVQQKPVG